MQTRVRFAPAILEHLRRSPGRGDLTKARTRLSYGLSLICLDDAPGNDDSELLEAALPEKVRRAAWRMLCADDAGIASRLPDGLARMIVVAVVAYQNFELITVRQSLCACVQYPCPQRCNVRHYERTMVYNGRVHPP